MMLLWPSESKMRISPVGGLLMCVIPLLLNPLIAAHVDTHVSIRPSSPSCSSLCPRLLGTPSTCASIALEPRSLTHVPVIPCRLEDSPPLAIAHSSRSSPLLRQRRLRRTVAFRFRFPRRRAG